MNIRLYEILFLVLVPGLVGGLLSGFSIKPVKRTRNEEKKSWEYTTDYTRFVELTLSGVVCAGVVTALLVWDNKISIESSTKNELIIIGLAAFAGSNGHRILRLLHDKLEKQIAQQGEELSKATKEMAQQSEEISKTAQEVDYTRKYSAAIAKAKDALDPNADYRDVPEAIEALETIKANFSTDRLLNIYLGRLYRKGKDYDQAIFTLRRFIAETRDRKAQAAALFNIACYHVLKAKEMPASADNRDREVERLKTEGIEAFQQSTEIEPEWRGQAATDEDFEFIMDDERFKQLIMDQE